MPVRRLTQSRHHCKPEFLSLSNSLPALQFRRSLRLSRKNSQIRSAPENDMIG
jgi:hypothetical protein